MQKSNLSRLKNKFLVGLAILFIYVFPVAAAKADWKSDLGTFRIGVVANSDSADLVARMEPFRLAVQEALGVEVTIIPHANLIGLISAHSEGRIEQAIMPAFAYAAAWQACECIEPLVVAKSFDQSSGIHSIIIARDGGSLTNAKGLIGKKIIALSKNSVATYDFPKFLLAKQGVDLGSQNTEFIFADSARDAAQRFVNGEGDALMGWSSKIGDSETGYTRGTFKRLAELNGGTTNGYRIIWTSQLIPHRVHSIKKSLAGEAKKILRELMVGLNANDPIAYDAVEPIYSGGHALIKQSAFNELVEYVRAPSTKNQSGLKQSQTINDKADTSYDDTTLNN